MSSTTALSALASSAVAQSLLRSTTMARLAYTWTDGSPRVVPMWFEWTGETVLMGAPPNAPKTSVLVERPQVALVIDTDWPYQVLTIRGRAQIKLVDGFFQEYEEMARRYLGEAGSEQFLALGRQTFSQWARITVHPEAVRILDFGAGQFPSAWSAPTS
jgi:hypothetical protein